MPKSSEHPDSWIELSRHKEELEKRVEERTRELTATYKRLRLSERMAMMGTLAAGLGHDLGNLLVPVRVRLEALAREPLSAEARDHVAAIGHSAEYLRRLAHGLRLLALDPGRAQPGDATDVAAWWADAQGVLKSALPRGIVIGAEWPAGACVVAMSKPALTQVVFNLVQNAGDAMRERGAGRVLLRASTEGGAIVLEIADDGPGMTPEVNARCMEPFFTTKSRGISTGLGLVLVDGLVRSAGGSVEIRSDPGVGTTFVLRLLAATVADSQLDASGGTKAAVVDVKDARLRSFMTGELRSLRFDIHGPDSHEGTPDLFVLDDPERLALVPKEAAVVFLGEAAATSPNIRTLGRKPTIMAICEALREAARADPGRPGRRAGEPGPCEGGRQGCVADA